MLQMLRCYGKISYLCAVFNRIKRKRRIYRLCLEHARQYSMEREFRMACGIFGNPLEALEEVISSGCHRILTSGCQPSAEQGIHTLAALVHQAAGRIVILAGAGVTPANAAHIIQQTGVTEIHGSCKQTLPDGTIQTDPEIVKQLIKSITL